MIKGKESEVYLNFFKDSLPLILTFGLALLALSFFYLNEAPDKITTVEDWQMSYQNQNLNDRISLTDQAVSLIRSQVLDNKIGVNKSDDIKIYKSGPLLINLTDTGNSQNNLNMDVQNIDNYLKANFPLSEVGQPIYNLTPKPFLIFGLISFGIGSLFGIFIPLIKLYFKNF